MEIFKLETELIKFEDGNYNVVVKPQEPISYYINCIKFAFASELNETFIDDFIDEQTPLLFAYFQTMDNVPIEVRNQYFL